MTVGVLIIEILIHDSSSLKEKRLVLNRMKDRLKNKYNVSVAELDFLDKWQRSRIGIALIGNQYSHVEQSLRRVFDYLDNSDSYEIIDYSFDYV